MCTRAHTHTHIVGSMRTATLATVNAGCVYVCVRVCVRMVDDGCVVRSSIYSAYSHTHTHVHTPDMLRGVVHIKCITFIRLWSTVDVSASELNVYL